MLLVFFDREEKAAVENILLDKKIKIQAHSSDLSEGVAAQLRRYRGQNVG